MNMSREISASPLPMLTVAMIVRDAAKTLPLTLESIRSLTDSIVVTDTGSSDATLEVARRYTPDVFSVPWQHDFATARNQCLEKVRGQWVLWMDAGEHMDQDELRRLRDFVDNDAESNTAYRMMVRVSRSPHAIAAEQVARIRLLPNRPGIQFVGRVREDVAPALAKLSLTVENLPWCISRTADHHDQSTMAQKAQRDLELANLEIDQTENPVRGLNCLGEALQTLGEKNRAGDCFRRAIQNANRGSIEMLEGYYGLLTTLDGEPKSLEAQLAVCLEALDVFPLDMQLLCAMGGYLQGQNRLDLAARSYETAYRFGQLARETWHLEEIREIAAVCCSLAKQNEGQDDDAIAFLEEVLQENPESTRLRILAVEIYSKRQKRDDALRHAELLPRNTPHRDSFPTMIDGVCLAVDRQWKPALALLESAYQTGNRETLCLRWLVTSLIGRDAHRRAEQILSEWKKLEPANQEPNRFQEQIDHQRKSFVNLETSQTASSKDSTEQAHLEPPRPNPSPIPANSSSVGTIPSPPTSRNVNQVRIDSADSADPPAPTVTPNFARRSE